MGSTAFDIVMGGLGLVGGAAVLLQGCHDVDLKEPIWVRVYWYLTYRR
jgi:hypothetical protein